MSFGPADLAASRRMKTTRVGGGHPGYRTIEDPDPDDPEAPAGRPTAGPVALLDRPHGRRLQLGRDPALLRPLRRHQGRQGLRDAVPRRLPARLRRRLVAAPGPDRDREEGLQPRPGGGQVREEGARGDPRRPRRPHDRRQDAGRRDLEAVQGDGDARRAARREGSGAGRGVRDELLAKSAEPAARLPPPDAGPLLRVRPAEHRLQRPLPLLFRHRDHRALARGDRALPGDDGSSTASTWSSPRPPSATWRRCASTRSSTWSPRSPRIGHDLDGHRDRGERDGTVCAEGEIRHVFVSHGTRGEDADPGRGPRRRSSPTPASLRRASSASSCERISAGSSSPNWSRSSRTCGSWPRITSGSTVSSSRHLLLGDVGALGVDLARRRDAADRGLDRLALAVAAPEDPLEDADVLAEAGPDELAVVVLAEPVDDEDLRQLRRVRCSRADLQPVGEVVGHVVAAERQHRHRVEAQLADLARGGGGRLDRHRRGEEDAVLPVERLA